ncbi:hypothetical protein RIF29_12936 [Crotalaria pallida]|uniref:Uncharacterized protein n=1 Tax=Crotalaria pallida TaxID=3830 RepID=A0AAN9INV2_CROPI
MYCGGSSGSEPVIWGGNCIIIFNKRHLKAVYCLVIGRQSAKHVFAPIRIESTTLHCELCELHTKHLFTLPLRLLPLEI